MSGFHTYNMPSISSVACLEIPLPLYIRELLGEPPEFLVAGHNLSLGFDFVHRSFLFETDQDYPSDNVFHASFG
jgi:hypothetical protein